MADLISRYALEFVFGVFVLLVAVAVAAAFLLRFGWKRRLAIWRFVARGFRAVGKLPPLPWLVRRFPHVFSFLRHQLTAIEFLEIYLAAGLLLSLGVTAFLGLSQKVFGGEGLAAFDYQLSAALQRMLTPSRLTALHRLTALGNGSTITIIGGIVAVVLLARRHWSVATGWILALLGGGILNLALKTFFQRVRPEYSTIGGWSFPSGHAMGSFICYGMLAYLAFVFLPRHVAQICAAILLLLILFIGFTRIYLGVHYFSDVVAGYAAAIVWLVACVSGTEIARLRGSRAKAKAMPPPVFD
jgi:membrane-associated phospholipid phosphatase